MSVVTIHQAKTHLSRLIVRVLAGEEVIIARGKVEVAKLVPLISVPGKKRVGGWLAHQVPPGKDIIGDAFWEPLSDEEAGLASDISPRQ